MELVNGEDGVSDQWRMILLSLNHDSIYIRIYTWRIICTTQIDFAYEYTFYYLYFFVNSLINSYVYMRVNIFSLQANAISTNRDSTELYLRFYPRNKFAKYQLLNQKHSTTSPTSAEKPKKPRTL